MRPSKDPLPRRWLPVIAALLCCLSVSAPATLDAARTSLDLEREEFLRKAEIERTETLKVGVTAPLRATLSRDGLTHDAHIQRVDIQLKRFETTHHTYANFRDCYKFNIAAYRLDRLLGLNMVPVSVERKVRRTKAAVTWWVDDVMMSDADRYEKGIPPPDIDRWNDQKDQARIFNQLICNQDPNLGNFLIGKDWRLWLIDFTRSFRRLMKLQEARAVQRVDRRLYNGLRALDLEALERETAPYLTRYEMGAVMARRDAILQVLAARIAARGEAAVVCDLPGH